MACNSAAVRREKRTEIWKLGTLVTHISGTFDLLNLRPFWGHSCTILKMSCNSKTAGRRAKQSEIWESGTLVTHIRHTVDLVVSKAI